MPGTTHHHRSAHSSCDCPLSCCRGLMRVMCVPSGVSGSAVPRPVGPVPGLVVVRTLITGGKSPNRLSFVQHVEVFMYRGNGQVVVTGQVTHTAPPTARKAMAYSYICGGYGRSSVSQARQKEVAEAGIMYVKNYWKTMMFCRSSKKPRLSPYSDKYDVHVNIPYDSPVQVSQDMQPFSAKARPVCSNSECVCISFVCRRLATSRGRLLLATCLCSSAFNCPRPSLCVERCILMGPCVHATSTRAPCRQRARQASPLS